MKNTSAELPFCTPDHCTVPSGESKLGIDEYSKNAREQAGATKRDGDAGEETVPCQNLYSGHFGDA